MTDFQYTPQELATINNCVEECVNSLVREEGEKSLRKDILDRAKEELKMKPAMFNMLVKERFDSKSTKTLEKHEEIVELNEKLINAVKKSQMS